MAVEMGYHGVTNAALEASPYKWIGREPPANLTIVKLGEAIANIEQLAKIHKIGCFIVESALSVGGVRFPPQNWLSESFTIIKAAGGVCICDEIPASSTRSNAHNELTLQGTRLGWVELVNGSGLSNEIQIARLIL
jgi:4-aminobutyrate aminotransferase-like enzyme